MHKLGLLAVLAVAVAAIPAPANAQNVVTCESYGGRRQTCRVDTRGEVRLVRRLSDASCVRGRSWGTTTGGVWVDDGCRAQFAVYGTRGGNDDRWDRDGRDGRGRDDRWDRNDRDGNWDRGNTESALNRCRLAVARRVGGRSVNAWVENRSRNNVRVGWRTNRGVRGTCRVERNGDVDVRVDRNHR
ncbi:MAG TPA: DUF3011 domain-containing protein [Longimicrobium sp.]|nr:DUF3011 domain-containing protein [Longimicrobium sp.]